MPKANVKAGLRPAEFAAAIGLSRSKFYELPSELRPHSVHLGTAHIIIEAPREYLRRIATVQREQSGPQQ